MKLSVGFRAVGRDADEGKSLCVHFDGIPSDDDLRLVSDTLRALNETFAERISREMSEGTARFINADGTCTADLLRQN